MTIEIKCSYIKPRKKAIWMGVLNTTFGKTKCKANPAAAVKPWLLPVAPWPVISRTIIKYLPWAFIRRFGNFASPIDLWMTTGKWFFLEGNLNSHSGLFWSNVREVCVRTERFFLTRSSVENAVGLDCRFQAVATHCWWRTSCLLLPVPFISCAPHFETCCRTGSADDGWDWFGFQRIPDVPKQRALNWNVPWIEIYGNKFRSDHYIRIIYWFNLRIGFCFSTLVSTTCLFWNT